VKRRYAKEDAKAGKIQYNKVVCLSAKGNDRQIKKEEDTKT